MFLAGLTSTYDEAEFSIPIRYESIDLSLFLMVLGASD